ncbi:MAG TPA: hypothetical protein VK504_12735 [Vicinamibacterales bacterium]|nr:hypothetical protein [Vicinamibacterales bacterium]
MSVVLAKTVNQSLLSLQSVASNTVVVGSAVDVSTKFTAFIGVHFGRRTASALTTGGKIRIEGSMKSSGDGHWFVLAEFQSAIAAAESEAVSGTVNAGTNVITVASTTNLTAGDLVFIDNGTIANSEWGRVKSISSNVSITIEDNLVNAQTGATIYDNAELFTAYIDLAAVTRIRAVADFSGTGQACAIEIIMVTADSIG